MSFASFVDSLPDMSPECPKSPHSYHDFVTAYRYNGEKWYQRGDRHDNVVEERQECK